MSTGGRLREKIILLRRSCFQLGHTPPLLPAQSDTSALAPVDSEVVRSGRAAILVSGLLCQTSVNGKSLPNRAYRIQTW